MNKKIEFKRKNFLSALASLQTGFAGSKTREVEIAGIIQMFEFTYETCWKLLKALLEDQGIQAESPKKVFVGAYSAGLVDDREQWLKMIEDRNLTAHTYKKEMALEILNRIEKSHAPLFQK